MRRRCGAVAKQLGAEHSTIWVTRADFEGALEHLLERMDQPTHRWREQLFRDARGEGGGAQGCARRAGRRRAVRGYADFVDIPRIAAAASGVCRARALGKLVRKRWHLCRPFCLDEIR